MSVSEKQRAQYLAKHWGLSVRHALYRKTGNWYHQLSKFPGALLDANGYVIFDTEKAFRTCSQLQIGKQVGAPHGIKVIPGYVHVSADDDFSEIDSKLQQFDKLDKERKIYSRREQAFLRDYLFGRGDRGTCVICGSYLPTSLLVAAHIKPRASCTDAERRDFVNNVVPMCLLGCDALFERGFLVAQEGKVKVRIEGELEPRLKNLVNAIDERPTIAWKLGRFRYFRWHAKQNRATLQSL